MLRFCREHGGYQNSVNLHEQQIKTMSDLSDKMLNYFWEEHVFLACISIQELELVSPTITLQTVNSLPPYTERCMPVYGACELGVLDGPAMNLRG